MKRSNDNLTKPEPPLESGALTDPMEGPADTEVASLRAVRGKPGMGMSFAANDIQSLTKRRSGGTFGTILDRGESFLSGKFHPNPKFKALEDISGGEVMFGSTKDGMSKPKD